MSIPLQTLLVGAGGYGVTHAEYLLSNEFSQDMCFAGVVDPYAKTSPIYDRLKSAVPIYDSMDTFFANHKVDFTIISTPIHLHYEQCLAAFENDSHILCEKPLVPTLAQLDTLEKKRGDKVLAVGFQWCWSDVLLSTKKRILSGEFGKPVSLKCFVSWPRVQGYFNRGTWPGKIRTPEGDAVFDSIISNATSHFLQNMMFLLGEDMEQSACAHNIIGEFYRANEIESFDTVVLKGKIGEADIYYSASHATVHVINPVMELTFENAVIWMNVTSQDFTWYIHHNDGQVENLGYAIGDSEKLRLSVTAKRIKGEDVFICTARTVRPFTSLINDIFNNATFHTFPKECIVCTPFTGNTYGSNSKDNFLVHVKNLHIDLFRCFNREQLPSEAGIYWAKPPVGIC